MRWTRVALAVAGVLVMGWGGWLLLPQLSGPTGVSVAVWFLGGPVLHDALLAPAVGLLALAAVAVVPARWRTAVAAGAVVSGVLVLLAVPALLQPSAGPPNPGLADRDYRLGLLVALGVVWLAVLVTVLATGWRGRRDRRDRRGRRGHARRAPAAAQAPSSDA